MEHLSYKDVCDISGSSMHLIHLKELAWATDKWLRVISNMMLFKTVISLRN